MVVITIDTNNDAFRPTANDELAIILRQLANAIDSAAPPLNDTSFDLTLRDTNGNRVGQFRYRKD